MPYGARGVYISPYRYVRPFGGVYPGRADRVRRGERMRVWREDRQVILHKNKNNPI